MGLSERYMEISQGFIHLRTTNGDQTYVQIKSFLGEEVKGTVDQASTSYVRYKS